MQSESSAVFCENAFLIAACCSIQGKRNYQEDRYSLVANIIHENSNSGASYFAVYDGHTGNAASSFCEERLLADFLSIPSMTDLRGLTDDHLEQKFLEADDMFRNQHDTNAGSCVNSVFVECKKIEHAVEVGIICANVGDSRSILYRNRVVKLSNDHKPIDPAERRRIVSAAASVKNGRVNGALAVSRSIGDRKFKTVESVSLRNQPVTPVPEITREKFTISTGKNAATQTSPFIVIGSDGLFDVMSNGDIANFVRNALKRHKLYRHSAGEILQKIAQELVDNALKRNSSDNITAVIVVFKTDVL